MWKSNFKFIFKLTTGVHHTVPNTIAGISVVVPFFTVPYQGWIGGIVSVNSTMLAVLQR